MHVYSFCCIIRAKQFTTIWNVKTDDSDISVRLIIYSKPEKIFKSLLCACQILLQPHHSWASATHCHNQHNIESEYEYIYQATVRTSTHTDGDGERNRNNGGRTTKTGYLSGLLTWRMPRCIRTPFEWILIVMYDGCWQWNAFVSHENVICKWYVNRYSAHEVVGVAAKRHSKPGLVHHYHYYCIFVWSYLGCWFDRL